MRRDLLSGIASAGDDENEWVFDMEAEANWEPEGFEGEDLYRVLIAEVHEHGEAGDADHLVTSSFSTAQRNIRRMRSIR
jgi:hypothetical protein